MQRFRQIWWWSITVGEDDWLYEFYTSGNNEALKFTRDLINTLIVTTAVTSAAYLIMAIALSPVIGLMTIYMGAYLGIAVNEINKALAAWGGNRFYIALFNHFMYTLVGCAFAIYTVWPDYSMRYIFPDPVSGAMYMLSPISAINAKITADAMHSFGDRYGYDRWVWVGYY